MPLLDTVRSILGIRPVKVGDLAKKVSTPPSRRDRTRPPIAQADAEDIEVIPEYDQVRALLQNAAPLVLVTGGAGTGKSTLIRYLRSKAAWRLAVVAPTGVAALNAQGVTIHSLFRLPPRIVQAADVKEVSDRQLYRKLDLLIIDEVSMVRPDLLDAVDRFLRLNRENNAPFGGVMVLLVGDLFQLPPVVPDTDHRVLREMHYATDYFFSSTGIGDCPLVPVFLRRAFRQTDPAFVSLLQDLREGNHGPETLQAINARCVGPPGHRTGELVLTCTNQTADSRNLQELSRLPAPERTYDGSIQGHFRVERSRLPAPVNLALKAGAQVMFTRNDERKRWVNGTIGRVVSLQARTVRVEIEQGTVSETVDVVPVTWEQYEYAYDKAEDRILPEVTGRYTQLPLSLAWAVTIHKAQGKTLDKILVDLGQGAFAPGQAYVALSRVRQIGDLRLARPIREEEIRVDPTVASFYRQLVHMTRIEQGEPPPHAADADKPRR